MQKAMNSLHSNKKMHWILFAFNYFLILMHYFLFISILCFDKKLCSIFAAKSIFFVVQSEQRLSGHYASIYPNQHELVLVRQQRDLFSGGPSPTLGIPDVTTHVGSVIHAFETLSQQRQQKDADKLYESSKSTSSTNRKETMHKIILPPPPSKVSTGTLTDPLPKHIVRHRPKGKAPDIPTTSSTNTASATTQTTKFSGDENESSALDSLNLEDDYRRNIPTTTTTAVSVSKFPQSYVKNYKVLPPFVPPRNQPSRIPTKAINKTSGNQMSTARNRLISDSLLSMPSSSAARTNVFLKPTSSTKHTTEEEVENDFLRGSTVSQSFIKNVVRKSPQARKLSTYEQNFLVNDEIDGGKGRRRARSSESKFEQPLIDEVSKRYKEYSGGNKNNDTSLRHSSRQFNFQPRSVDRAEL